MGRPTRPQVTTMAPSTALTSGVVKAGSEVKVMFCVDVIIGAAYSFTLLGGTTGFAS